MTALATLACLLASLSVTAEPGSGRPSITIIIDDLGYALEPGRRAIALPGPVVCAILPKTPRGRQLAELAHESGKEVLLHLPLQSVDPTLNDEPGIIGLDTTRLGFAETFAENLDTVPFVIGINGHRGSLLTRHPGHMRWLMEEVARRDLIFIDSYTTHRSVALRIASESGIPATRRDVFLDADPSPAAIDHEFERLLALARSRGRAVAIGHPYPATLDFLERRLPMLEDEGIELIGIGRMLKDTVARDSGAIAAAGTSEPAACAKNDTRPATSVEPACPQSF